MPLLTVYTPTYNRAYILHECYESLLRQTNQNFKWLIVDDGSTDQTNELVNIWIKEGKIDINYIYQENQGVHVARNKAIENIDTYLNVCIDSDDHLPDNAVELITKLWTEKGGEQYAGIIGWDVYKSGKVVGKKFPESLEVATLMDLYEVYNIPGDKKPVYRTDIAKLFPSPQFEGENYFPNRYKYSLTDEVAPCLLLHEPLCIVEYLPDGITANLFTRYLKNPRGFIFYREFLMKKSNSLYKRLRQAIHLNAMQLHIKNNGYIKKSEYPITVAFALPLGWILLNYIKYKAKKKG
ncbi:glycosyltransferase family 2 protein [Planococcus sp. NCCP-2050]|uniref:glycosyltransferase family 2 protein n=1 Tax=Planococcus sp. NCCP-2050 TaxID=2944679 RepID=UPI0020871D84|nr:beta-glycosyltransferase [Planococcus sp. NCCP-2050]